MSIIGKSFSLRRALAPCSLSQLNHWLLSAQSNRDLHCGALDDTVGLNEEQIQMQTIARDFAEKEWLPNMQKWDEQHLFPRASLQAAAALGFGALRVRDEFGGSGLGSVDSAVVFEALARGCTSTAAYLTLHNMSSWMIDTFGSIEQRMKWIPGLVTMELCSSYCLTEPESGSDASSLTTKAVRDGDHYVLNGTKALISGGGESEIYVCMVRTNGPGPKGITCLVVEKGTPGLSFGKNESKLGWNTHPTRAVVFEDCRVPIANRLGEEGDGFKIAMKGLNNGRINMSACSVGAAAASLDFAIDYTKQRKQFGKPISENQVVQFRLAEMATKLQASRLMVRQAARATQDSASNATQFCAMAKYYVTETCFHVVNDAMQLLGGYGFIKEYPIQQYFRDCRAHPIIGGTNEIMRFIIARDLLR